MSDKETAREKAWVKDYEAYFKNDGKHLDGHPSNNRRIYEMDFDAGWARSEASPWVPVRSDADNPKESGDYIVTARYGRKDGYSHLFTAEFEWIGYWHSVPEFDEVIAWMPLPSPYNEMQFELKAAKDEDRIP